MIYGYIRVSTDLQTTENQRFEIKNFAQDNNIDIDMWFEETISGTKDIKERKLGKLLKKLKVNDIIITTELSRLGRNLLQIMSILHDCMRIGAKVWTIKDNYRLGDDIQSKVLAFAFGLSAEIERNLISQRTKRALARKKAEGIILGRPKGRRNTYLKLSCHDKEIKNMLDVGCSYNAIAKRFGVHRTTVARYVADVIANEVKQSRIYI